MISIDFQILKLPVGALVLDIGCGSGRHTAAAYTAPRTLVVGADRNIDDLHQAAERLRFHDKLQAHGNGSWHLCGADVTALPFGDACFDAVICSEVLEHVPCHDRAVQEIIRILKIGGTLAISVPRRWPETLMWALSKAYRTSPGGHIRIYRKEGLITLVEKTGARFGYLHHAHSLHTPFWLLKCLVGPENDHFLPVRLYHRFLTWDILQKPRFTRLLEKLLNPVLGKSLVLYFRKH
jgi:SAM-dependent methyltransferase